MSSPSQDNKDNIVVQTYDKYTKTADDKSWMMYALSVVVVAVIVLVLKPDYSNLSFVCPTVGTANLINVLHAVFAVGLLVYYSTDKFASLPADSRRNGVLLLAGLVYAVHVGKLIYRTKKGC